MKLHTARHAYQLNKLESAMQGLKTAKVPLWETVRQKVQHYLDTHPVSKHEIDLDLEDEDDEDDEDAKSVRSSRSVKSSESLKGFPQQKKGGDEQTRSDKSRKSRASSRENLPEEV